MWIPERESQHHSCHEAHAEQTHSRKHGQVTKFAHAEHRNDPQHAHHNGSVLHCPPKETCCANMNVHELKAYIPHQSTMKLSSVRFSSEEKRNQSKKRYLVLVSEGEAVAM